MYVNIQRHDFWGKSDSVFRRHVVPPAIQPGTLPGTMEKLSKSYSLGTIGLKLILKIVLSGMNKKCIN